MTTTFNTDLWNTAFDNAGQQQFPLPGHYETTPEQSAAITSRARAADAELIQYNLDVSAGIMAETPYEFSFWEEYDYLIIAGGIVAYLFLLIGVLIPIAILFMR